MRDDSRQDWPFSLSLETVSQQIINHGRDNPGVSRDLVTEIIKAQFIGGDFVAGLDPIPVDPTSKLEVLVTGGSSNTATFGFIVSGNENTFKLEKDGTVIASGLLGEQTANGVTIMAMEEGWFILISSPLGSYTLSGGITRVGVLYDEQGPDNGTNLDVVSFSGVATHQVFLVVSAGLTVPEVLPTTITNMDNMFNRCTNFNQDISMWDTSNVTTMVGTFSEAVAFNQDIGNWDVSNVTDMSDMFSQATVFNQDISGWNVDNLTNMNSMFRKARAFNQDISAWNVSNVTNMNALFLGAVAFNQDISGWNVGNVMNMNDMFREAAIFDQDLSSWSVLSISSEPHGFSSGADSWYQPKPVWGTDGSVVVVPDDNSLLRYVTVNANEDMSWRHELRVTGVTGPWSFTCDGQVVVNQDTTESDYFLGNNRGELILYGGYNTGSQHVYTFNGDVSNDIQIIAYSHLVNSGCSVTIDTFSDELAKISFRAQDAEIHIPAQLAPLMTNLSGMFFESQNIITDITGWDTSNVYSMSAMFYGATNFNQDISGWDVSNLEEANMLFHGALSFNQDLSGWNAINVSDSTDFDYNTPAWTLPKPVWGGTVYGSTGLVEDYPGTGWYKATDTGTVFCKGVASGETCTFEEGGLEYVAANTKSLAVQYGDRAATSNITKMGNLFQDNRTFNLDISSWDVSSVTDMDSMFQNCPSFNRNISSWDTSSVVTMESMFFGANSFNQDISEWDTSSVTTMRTMFSNCDSFNQPLDLWDTGNVLDMAQMFRDTNVFNQDISGWNVLAVTDMNDMFRNALAFNQNISSWDVSAVTTMTNMFNYAEVFNQDLSIWNVENISSIPEGFSEGTSNWILPKPVWGTVGGVVPPSVVVSPDGWSIDSVVVTGTTAAVTLSKPNEEQSGSLYRTVNYDILSGDLNQTIIDNPTHPGVTLAMTDLVGSDYEWSVDSVNSRMVCTEAR